MVRVAQLVEHLVVVQEVAGSSPVTHPRRRVFGGPVRGHLPVILVSSFVLGGDPPDPHGAIGSDPAWGCALRFARASGPPFPSRDLSSGNGSALGRVLLICVPRRQVAVWALRFARAFAVAESPFAVRFGLWSVVRDP